MGRPALGEKEFQFEDVMYHLENKVEVQPNGCWHYTGKITVNGYGEFSHGLGKAGRFKKAPAHRVVYLWYKGAIPDGYVVDHMCHNEALAECTDPKVCLHKRCVNPGHLQAITYSQNSKLGAPISYDNRTHCLHGHELTEDNIGWRIQSKSPTSPKVRFCRTCVKAQALKTRQKKKAKVKQN